MAEPMRGVIADRMRIRFFILASIAVVAGIAMLASHWPSKNAEATIERQAQVPAPMGAVWCKSADECPQRHVRPPE